MITQPTELMSFTDWADTLRLTRPDLKINPRVVGDKMWKEWVYQLLQNPQCSSAPRPEGFVDWRDWARRFIQSFGANS